ncbi:hypothetical protein J4E91_009316 [Alternaria rosae]|nr:hypothetical protein J4E91_009316 [Alternaria rosae]
MAQFIDRHPKGYPKLALLMGEFPDVAIFRRFGSLSALNLMRLQAELIEIEEALQLQQLRDDEAGQPGERYSISFSELNLEKATKKGEQGHPNQMALLESARTKLITYHNLLLTAAKVTQLRKPSDSRLRFLRRWLRMDTGGANFQEGIELEKTWDEGVKRDLVVLTREDHEENNALSAWFTPKLVSAYHYIFQSLRSPITTEAGDVYDYEDSKAVKSVTWLITLLATIAISLLPSLIILWLFHVKRTIIRIWITIGATITIGVLLRIFTTATMKEIFGGTAAYVFPYIY